MITASSSHRLGRPLTRAHGDRRDPAQCSSVLFDTPMISMMGRELRGWNGTLVVRDDRVIVRRGIRGRLVRKRRDPGVEVLFGQLATVRYAPAGAVAGYV